MCRHDVNGLELYYALYKKYSITNDTVGPVYEKPGICSLHTQTGINSALAGDSHACSAGSIYSSGAVYTGLTQNILLYG